MASFNKCIFLANLTRDPELSYTPQQKSVCKFGIAMNRKYRTAAGEDRDEVCYLDCEAWGRMGEVINQHFHRGKPILVEGELKYQEWTDKTSGQKRSRHILGVSGFQFAGGNKPAGNGGDDGQPPLSDGDIPEFP